MDLKSICSEVESISKEVGAFLLHERKHFDQNLVEEKSFNNLVSYVDKSAEQKFMSKLGDLLPGAGFIAEESEELKPDDTLNWVIDPLDGTTNFIFNLPFYCTSVALLKNDEILVGVIYDPTHDELFSAYKDGGAFLNGKQIKVSPKNALIDSLIATGFPYDDFQFEAEYMLLLTSLMKKSKGIRRLGSAALDLAYVACGRFDVFYEYGLNSYDVAAGALIVKEAGGAVSDFKGGNDFIFGEEILSSNKKVHEETLKEIQKFFLK
jgi:myo-inositol-1(or 4)-monophosphatase